MREYTTNPDKYSSSISTCVDGKWQKTYFNLYCDICGAKHGDVQVNELCPEEGFPDGAYCWECQKAFEGDDWDKLRLFLSWARDFVQKNELQIDGFWTDSNECFSWSYSKKLINGKYIIINKDFGKDEIPEYESEPEFTKERLVKYRTQPWYYKDKGKVFEGDVLKEELGIAEKKVHENFPKTREILSDIDNYLVMVDTYGPYYLTLLAYTGKEFGERTFKTLDLFKLREFVENTRPKGVIITLLTSENPPKIDFSPLIDLFDIPEMDYLKFNCAVDTKNLNQNKYTEWVVAYAR